MYRDPAVGVLASERYTASGPPESQRKMEWNLSPVTHDSPVTQCAPLTHAERTTSTH